MANKPSAEELKKNLSEMQFYVTQNHGTEPPFTGRLLHNKRDGVYHCLICDAPLFHSETKYDSGCGWPSFYEPVSEESIRYQSFQLWLEVWCSLRVEGLPVGC